MRIVATCCYSTMCIDHPGYLKKIVTTFPQFAAVTPPPATPPDILMVTQEWPTSFTPLASTGRDPYKGRAFNTHSDARFLAKFVFRVLSRGRKGSPGSNSARARRVAGRGDHLGPDQGPEPRRPHQGIFINLWSPVAKLELIQES